MEITDSKGKVHEVVPSYFQPIGTVVPPDVHRFNKVLDKKSAVFAQRRSQYGDHTDKANRFPHYIPAEIYTKCVRIIGMYERGEPLDDDTLLDLSNYCDMELSTRGAEE